MDKKELQGRKSWKNRHKCSLNQHFAPSVVDSGNLQDRTGNDENTGRKYTHNYLYPQ